MFMINCIRNLFQIYAYFHIHIVNTSAIIKDITILFAMDGTPVWHIVYAFEALFLL